MNFRLAFSAVAIVVLTIVSGFFQGRASGRWITTDLEPINLTAIPTSFGDWIMTDEQEVEAEVLKLLQAEGSVLRVYSHQQTGQQIAFALIAGPHGPISVHIPEICYSSRQYKQTSQRQRMSVDSGEATDEYWSLSFLTNDVHAAPMSVCYAWSSGGRWEAPDAPRRYYADAPRLFKLQISAMITSSDQSRTDDACSAFLKDFVEHVWPLDAPS